MSATLRIPAWLAKDRHLTREIEVDLIRETEKAILVKGTIRTGPAINCARCGRKLTNPVSRVVGIGPECCEKLGVPRPDFSDAKALDDQLKVATFFDNMWIPKSQMELISGELKAPKAAPTQRSEPEETYLTVVGNELRLKVPFQDRPKAKSIFGYKGWDGQLKAWKMVNDPFVIAQILETWPDIPVEGIEIEPHPDVQYLLNEGLYPFQKEGVQRLVQQKKSILGDDMGLGKTIECIETARILNLKRVLVICPGYVKDNWKRECDKWYPEANAHVIKGDAEERELQYLDQASTITITNFEALFGMGMEEVKDPRTGQKSMKRGKIAFPALKMVKWDMVIIDESHRFKGRKTKTFNAIKAVCKDVPYVICATGTPILNTASELWPLLHVMFPKVFRGYWKYAETFCDVYNNGYGMEVEDIDDPTNEKIVHLRAILNPILIRRTKEEVFPEMPKKIITKVYVDLEGKQSEQYTDMEELMLAELDDKTVFASIPLAQMTRLRQIAIDPTLMDPENNDPLVGPKANAALNLIEDAEGQKFVIFSQFKKVIDKFQKVLDLAGISSDKITGDVAMEDRQAIVDTFHSDPTAQILLTTIQAGGVGLNLQCAANGIFFDKDWTPKINEQAQDRLYRHGQESTVNIYELFARNTIEANIEGINRKKTRITDIVIEGRQ
jgi:SNF2 family DNA or RNA helicase